MCTSLSNPGYASEHCRVSKGSKVHDTCLHRTTIACKDVGCNNIISYYPEVTSCLYVF